MEVENRYIAIKHHVDGRRPSESDFELRSAKLAFALDEGSKDVVVKNLFVSIDPYQINRMKQYSPSQAPSGFGARQEPDQAIAAAGVGRVMVSGNQEFKTGDLVVGVLEWGDYTILKPGSMLQKIGTTEFPLTYHVGVLGQWACSDVYFEKRSSGLTAYAGFFDVCKPKAGEKVFVSAASGSVGNLVGQFAKLAGCYVVGCAGSKEKVDLLKEKLGFSEAFNYKEEKDLKSTLKRYFPDGIDIYFDNVGAEMLEAAVANMNDFGRVAVCGVISEYTNTEKRAAPDMVSVIYKRITIRGFLAYDHVTNADFIANTSDHLRNGRVHVIEDISQGLESVPSAFVGLFRGDNVGKKLVQLADI